MHVPAAVAAKRGEGGEEAARKPACTDDLEGPVERGPVTASRSGGCTQHGATDRTVYGKARPSTRDFLTHHTRRIVKATVVSGATTICEQVINLKQRACALAGEAAA